jgi:ATP-dependent protease ClpP protease subunit
MNEEDFTPTIHLRINSYGGDLFAGISTVDTIRDLKSRVYTYVEGAAASAATIISIAGKKRFIGKNAFMLIHQLSSVCAGTYEQMNDGQENNKRLMALIKSLYKQYTKIPMKELDSILKHDLWMDSDTCLKYGLVDNVI